MEYRRSLELTLKVSKKLFAPHSNEDISLAKKYLGYDPEYSFEAGINLAIDWYKENL